MSRLRQLGYDLIAADSPNSFLEDTPTANLIRQVLGAVSQFEKASLVAKLKGARDRKRREMAGIGERGIKAMVKKQSSERSVFYGLAGLSSLSLVR